MTCKLTPEDHAAMTRWAENLGENFALSMHEKGASLGAAREGAIAAFTRGIDRKAAQILAGHTAAPDDTRDSPRTRGHLASIIADPDCCEASKDIARAALSGANRKAGRCWGNEPD